MQFEFTEKVIATRRTCIDADNFNEAVEEFERQLGPRLGDVLDPVNYLGVTWIEANDGHGWKVVGGSESWHHPHH